MWKIEYKKILKEFNDYPDNVKKQLEMDETDSDTDSDTDEENEPIRTILNLGIYSSRSDLKGLLKVLSEEDENIDFVKFQTSKKDRSRQEDRILESDKDYMVWTDFRNPSEDNIPLDCHCISRAGYRFRRSGQPGIRENMICNAHTTLTGEIMKHDRYCEHSGGECVVLSTFAFKKEIIDKGGWNAEHRIYKEQWEQSRFSYNSIYNIFKPIEATEELSCGSPTRNIKIVRQDDNFYIKSTSHDNDFVGEHGILEKHLSGKLGLTVKIMKPLCGQVGDVNILEKLKIALPNNGDQIDPYDFKDKLCVADCNADLGDYIFGHPELDESNSKLCFTNILWSSKPKRGAKNKGLSDKKRFEGPVQINLKEGKQSASVRIYDTGKIMAINMPISWTWFNEKFTEILNSKNVLNVDKWESLLRDLKIYNSNEFEIVESNKFYLIDELSFVKSIHGEIYYEGPHSILNLEQAKQIIDNSNLGEFELVSAVLTGKNRLIVNLTKNLIKIALQFYEKNFSAKTDVKAISQFDISLMKDIEQNDKGILEPNSSEMIEIQNAIVTHILSKLPLTHVTEVKEEITDAMRQDFVVPGKIPQKKVTGHPMYPCRTAKERPVPYNFTGECNTAPFNNMNYHGVKSEVDNRYYPCCGKDTSKNIKKKRLALKEGFPRDDQERQLYDLPKEGEIDWHSGVFSNPIIPGENIDIMDEGEIKNATIKDVSGKNNVNVRVEVDDEEKEINRLDIIPQNRTFKGLVDVPEEKLRSKVEEFCEENSDACKDIDWGESKEETQDLFSKLGIDRQNIVPLSANGFKSFTRIPYIAAAVPVGVKETYIWLRPDGIFEVDGNAIKRIDDRCGIEPEIVLHVFEKDNTFYPIDLLYWGIKVSTDQPYMSSDPNVQTRLAGLSVVWNECLRNKMINPFAFINYPGREQGKAPDNIQEHTKNIVNAGFNILFIPMNNTEPFYSCCPNMFTQIIKMKVTKDGVGADDGIIEDIKFEKGSTSNGEVWNFRLDVSDMTWKPLSKTDSKVTLEEIQSEIENVRHPVSKRIFRSIPWKVRFRNRVVEYSSSRAGLYPLQENIIM